MQENSTGYIKIDEDKFQDAGKIYKVLSYFRRDNSTAVELELEFNGRTMKRVVPIHAIEWIEDGNW